MISGEPDETLQRVGENIGGFLGEIIKRLDGKQMKCWEGSCGKLITLDNPLAYRHDSGLPDGKGDKWWLCYMCRDCGYIWSWQKATRRIV